MLWRISTTQHEHGAHVPRQWDQCKGKQVYFFLLVMTLFFDECCRGVCTVIKTYVVTPVQQLWTASDVWQIPKRMKPLFFFNAFSDHCWTTGELYVRFQLLLMKTVSFCFVAYSCNRWTLHKKTDQQQVWILATRKTEQSAIPFSACAALFLTGEGRSWASETWYSKHELYIFQNDLHAQIIARYYPERITHFSISRENGGGEAHTTYFRMVFVPKH